jgi:hypothetical protein
MWGFLMQRLLVKGCVLLLCVAGLAAGASSFPSGVFRQLGRGERR